MLTFESCVTVNMAFCVRFSEHHHTEIINKLYKIMKHLKLQFRTIIIFLAQ